MTLFTGTRAEERGKGELISIQVLRGFAAVLVIFHHAHEQFSSVEKVFPTTVGAGGVDLFFVISGFVMIYTTSKRSYSPTEFLLKRIMRIVPLYWLMTFATAVLLIVAGNLVDNSVFTTGSLVKSLVFLPHRNPADYYSFSPMLKLGWTLNYEMFFYVVFSAVLFLSNWTRVSVLFIVFSLIVWFAKASGTTSAPVLVWGNTIVFEFLFGCMIGALDVSGLLSRANRLVWLAVLGAGGVAFIALADSAVLPRVLCRGLPASLLVMALVALERFGQVKVVAPLKLIGDASYSIYLSHLYVVILFRVLWKKLHLPIDGMIASVTFVGLCMTLGVLAGLFTYRFVERRLTEFAQTMLKARPVALA